MINCICTHSFIKTYQYPFKHVIICNLKLGISDILYYNYSKFGIISAL